MSNDTYTKIQAAMFAALGTKTKLSRSGISVVFVEPIQGRHDLSSDDDKALFQAREAGLDPDAVTEEQVASWLQWSSKVYEMRRTGPEARYLITRKFSMAVGSNALVAGNRVSLIDGWGNIVASAEVECLSKYDSQATNQIGQKGAFATSPDYPTIFEWIMQMREQLPEFAGTRVLDNNLEAQRG